MGQTVLLIALGSLLSFGRVMRKPGLGCILYLICCQTSFVFGQGHYTDSLKQLLARQQGVSRIGTLNALAKAPDAVGVDSALSYAAEAFRLTRHAGDDKAIVASEYQLAFLHTRKKNDSLAVQHFKHALGVAGSLNDAPLMAEGYLMLARYYQGVSDHEKCIDYANQALDLAVAHNLRLQTADAHSRLAAGYKLIGSYQNSLNHCFSALRIYEALKNFTEVARTFNDIGTVYQRTDDLDEALGYFTRALKMNDSIHYVKAVTGNIVNIGVIHQKKRNYEEALRYYLRALPMTREQGDKLREAIITGNIGSTLVEQGKVAEGLAYLNQALVLKEEVNVPRNILHTLNDIADARIKLGDAQAARATAERVIAMATRFKEADQLRFGYLNLSKSYRLASDFEKAHAFLEKYNAINDSLFNVEKAQGIRELEIRYNTEKKDMTINALQQEKQIANAQRKIWFLIGTIVLLVLTGLYISQRLKTKRHRQLLETEREVDRLKSEFFANMSHEFRTPLSLILGPIKTLQDKISDPGQRLQLELMEKSAQRLLRLINQILDLSKLQHGSFVLKVSEFNAVERIKGVCATFQSLLESKSIHLAFESNGDTIMLFADAEQLETICINLISNAIKFTDAGGVIVVKVNRADDGLELQVADNGMGIAPDEVARIFDRFYRAGSATEKRQGGTGIGLALTKELVDLHHGTIQVSSEPGKGTAVTIRMPLGHAHFREDQIVQPGQQHAVQQQVPAGIRRVAEDRGENDLNDAAAEAAEKPLVLLIEDNADVRTYVKSILEPGYNLLLAVSGEDGLKQAGSFVPDLIISDVMMPGMNGYEVCRHLKKDEKTSHIPVILLTAKASIDSRIQGLETEADLYLSKPFVPRELLLYIGNLIQGRRKLRERYNRQVVLKPSDIAINSLDEQFLQRLMKVVEANFEDENFSVEQLSAEMGMSRSQLHRKLHALTNESCSQFIRTFRLQRAMAMLKKKSGSVSEIAFKVGFASPSYFNKCFLQQYGCTPSSVMEGATHNTIL